MYTIGIVISECMWLCCIRGCHLIWVPKTAVLTLRAWALWRKDKKLGYALPVFILLCWVPALAITGVFLNSMQCGYL